MKKVIERSILALLLVAAFGIGVAVRPMIVNDAIAADAQTIPKSWGTLKGSIGTFLIFEDSEGTVRLVFMEDVSRYRTFTRK